MLKYKVVVKSEIISSAHFIKGYPGKCANMHGHNYMVEVGVEGPLDKTGMVIDFSILKSFLHEIEEEFDHKIVNNVLGEQATAERMAQYIFDKLKEKITFLSSKLKLSFVRVYETPDSYAEVSFE
jgi:6-pyruvoyltetrahydropterin/6-carboxytetrahydropterin synthase